MPRMRRVLAGWVPDLTSIASSLSSVLIVRRVPRAAAVVRPAASYVNLIS